MKPMPFFCIKGIGICRKTSHMDKTLQRPGLELMPYEVTVYYWVLRKLLPCETFRGVAVVAKQSNFSS